MEDLISAVNRYTMAGWIGTEWQDKSGTDLAFKKFIIKQEVCPG